MGDVLQGFCRTTGNEHGPRSRYDVKPKHRRSGSLDADFSGQLNESETARPGHEIDVQGKFLVHARSLGIARSLAKFRCFGMTSSLQRQLLGLQSFEHRTTGQTSLGVGIQST